VCRLIQFAMPVTVKAVLVSLLVASPALIFWIWLVILATRFTLLCPDGCWCSADGDKIDCSNSSLDNIPVIFHKQVRSLTLDYNNLTYLKEDVFLSSALPRLEVLSIDDCNLVGVEPGAFNGLTILVQLSLMSNMIREIKPLTFGNMSSLKRLYLGYNVIENLEPDSFFGLSDLEYLHIGENNIKHIHPDLFIHSPNLEMLILERNQQLEIPTDGHFMNSHSLRNLFLSNCSVTSVSMKTFEKVVGLKLLDLSANHLTDIDVNVLISLPKLSEFYLYKNPLQCDCQLQEVWRWCEEHNIETAYGSEAPVCDTPSEVEGLWWGVLQSSQCSQGHIAYHRDYRNIKYIETDNANTYNIEYEDYITLVKYIQGPVHVVLFIFGSTGNVIILIIIICNKDMRTVPNMHLLNLAVSDIISLTVNLPIYHAYVMSDTWKHGLFLCKFFAFSRRLSVGLSAYSVAVLSIQRYNITVNPLHIRVFSPATCRVTVAAICGVWIVASIFALPSTISANVDLYCTHYDSQIYYTKVVVFELLVACILPLCVIVFSYVMTARHLVKSALSMSQQMQHPQENTRRNIAKIVLGLSFVFVISYGPYHIIWTYITVKDFLEKELVYIYSVSTCLLVLNSCLNPVALCCTSLAFRKHFKRYITCRYRRNSTTTNFELTRST
jgi:gastrin-releasing peptide receptor